MFSLKVSNISTTCSSHFTLGKRRFGNGSLSNIHGAYCKLPACTMHSLGILFRRATGRACRLAAYHEKEVCREWF